MLLKMIGDILGTTRNRWRIQDVHVKRNSSSEISFRNAADNANVSILANGLTIPSGSPLAGKFWRATGAGGIGGWAFPQSERYREGLIPLRMSNSLIHITPGQVMAAGATLITTTAATVLDLATAGNWITGAVEEQASEYVKCYVNVAGQFKLSRRMPQFSVANLTNRIATGQINGSPGFNGTSIIYDNATGAASIAAGMLLVVYTDSGREQGRMRGSGGGSSYDAVSTALITAINTGTSTITVEAGHGINLTDNDYWAVVPYDEFMWYYDGANFWRFLGMIYNNASSNLDDAHLTKSGRGELESTDIVVTSGTYADINAAFATTILAGVGKNADINFGAVVAINASTNLYFTVLMDGLSVTSPTTDGISLAQAIITTLPMHWLKPMLPGTHNFKPQYRIGGTAATLFTDGVNNLGFRAQFSVQETYQHY